MHTLSTERIVNHNSTSTKIVIADDHPLILVALRQMLGFHDSFKIIGEARNGDELLQILARQQADILILDLVFPGASPTQILDYLKSVDSKTKVLILSAYDEQSYVQEMLAAGVSGYILKLEAASAVEDAIYTIMRGGTWLSQSVVQKMTQIHLRTEQSAHVNYLTERELEVLQCMSRGYSNQEISNELCISVRTVKYHIKNIFGKLETNSRAKAIFWAWQHRVAVSDVRSSLS